MDETYKVAITRLGDRIRVGGTAEISGYDLRLHARGAPRWSIGRRPFPGGGDHPGKLLVRAEADDPGRSADRRRAPRFRTSSQHRPRHAGLDDGLWLGPGAGRHRPGRKPESTSANSDIAIQLAARDDPPMRAQQAGFFPDAESSAPNSWPDAEVEVIDLGAMLARRGGRGRTVQRAHR